MRGRQVLQRLEQGARAARRHAASAVSAATEVRNRVSELTQARTRTLQQLAQTRLPELNEDTAAKAMPEFASELQEVERQRQEREQELIDLLQQLESSLQLKRAALEQCTEELDRAVAERDGLLEDVSKHLQTIPEYGPLAAEAQHAEVKLARDIARQEEIEAEAEEKLPPYEQSRFFQYLWNRHYGTPDYESRGFVRRMDKRLADFIGYPEAVLSYRFLRTTPEIVELEIQRRSEEAEKLRGEVEAMEAEVEEQFGVPAVRERGEELGRRREQLVAEFDELQQKIVAVHQKQHDEVGARGVYYREALSKLTGFLARAEQLMLERRVRDTADLADDRLVAELQGYGREIESTASQLPDLDGEADERDQLADRYERLLVDFRRAEYDSGRSRFRGLNDRELRECSSPDEIDTLWRTLRSKQWFEPAPIVRHRHRTGRVLDGIGMAAEIAGAILDAGGRVSRSRRRSSGGWGGIGRTIGRSIGRTMSRGRSSGGGFGGGGFTSGSGF